MDSTARLDSVDIDIVRRLQQDGMITNRALADAVGVAPSTCSERVHRLRAAGVISGGGLRVDPETIGRPVQAFLNLRVQPHRRPLVQPLIDHVLSQPETIAVYHLTGPNDYLVHVAASGVADLQRLVLEEFTSRREVVLVQTTLIFQQWNGGPLLPPGVPRVLAGG